MSTLLSTVTVVSTLGRVASPPGIRPWLTRYILRSQPKPDWLAIATTLRRTQARESSAASTLHTHATSKADTSWIMPECYDLWRKVLLPNLLANKPWANSSKDWSTDEKVELLLQVIQVGRLGWDCARQPG